MYSYDLLVHIPATDEHAPPQLGTANAVGCRQVRPGPDLEFDSWPELQDQVLKDFGELPSFFQGPPLDMYIEEEVEVEVRGVWFVVCVAGSVTHTFSPLVSRVAWEYAARKDMLQRHFPVEELGS